MTTDEFATITRRVIAESGFDGYLPTLLLPQRNQIAVLQGVPDDVDIEQAALEWAAQKAGPHEEYLVAYKSGASRFKIVHVRGDDQSKAEFEAELPR